MAGPTFAVVNDVYMAPLVKEWQEAMKVAQDDEPICHEITKNLELWYNGYIDPNKQEWYADFFNLRTYYWCVCRVDGQLQGMARIHLKTDKKSKIANIYLEHLCVLPRKRGIGGLFLKWIENLVRSNHEYVCTMMNDNLERDVQTEIEYVSRDFHSQIRKHPEMRRKDIYNPSHFPFTYKAANAAQSQKASAKTMEDMAELMADFAKIREENRGILKIGGILLEPTYDAVKFYKNRGFTTFDTNTAYLFKPLRKLDKSLSPVPWRLLTFKAMTEHHENALLQVAGAQTKITYKGSSYKIRSGKLGGRYILVGNKKVYYGRV